MASLGETLLLIEKRKTSNMDLYVVLSDGKTEGEEVTFLKQDDAFEFARTLLNGGKKIEKQKAGRGGIKPHYSISVTQKRRDFILGFFSTPHTVKDLMNAAKSHKDKDISGIPKGSLSSITSTLCRKKKLAMLHRVGLQGVYKTVTRG